MTFLLLSGIKGLNFPNNYSQELFLLNASAPANIYLFKVNSRNRNTRKGCQIFLKLTRKTLERRQWRRFGVFIVNFELISHLFSSAVLLNKWILAGFVLFSGVCVPRPSALGPRPQKYCKNKFVNKAYYLFKIVFIQD